jgi:hypothetical protein
VHGMTNFLRADIPSLPAVVLWHWCLSCVTVPGGCVHMAMCAG